MRNIDSLLEVNGDRLYVRLVEKETTLPTLVFLHDSLGCVSLWRDFPFQLAEATGCNLLLYDRKGYGKSEPLRCIHRTNEYLEEEADILHTLLLQLQITNPILFGHSDGGSIALIAAAKYPTLVARVIAEAAHIFVEGETLDGIRAAEKSYRETELKARLFKYHGGKTEAVFRAWTDTWLSEAYRTWNIEHFLPSIGCPVLVIQGENDEYGTMKQVEGITRQVKGRAEPYILPGVGHTPHKEAPQETADRVQQFMETIGATSYNKQE
ncbi:MAG TPA: alpha/beta hydrolase [Verrucomicrobiae bacterium]|nr:alpha/beta hydrolase [Verrucomicrobiae bacterium]